MGSLNSLGRHGTGGCRLVTAALAMLGVASVEECMFRSLQGDSTHVSSHVVTSKLRAGIRAQGTFGVCVYKNMFGIRYSEV